jgi:hypothetical protein
VVEGVIQNTGFELAPPGWFERKCQEANCQWSLPMAKRMSEGECVPVEEILEAYLKHNGGAAPCGKWSQLFHS